MKPTILYVDHTAKMGGGEVALLNLVTGLNTERFTPVVVLASEGKLADRLRERGVETHVLPLDGAVLETRKDSLGPSSMLKFGRIAHILSYSFRLSRFARQRKVDLIHTNSLKSDLFGGIAGRLARIPVVWHVRDHINDQYLPRVVASAFRWLARRVPNAVVTNSQSTLNCLMPSRQQRTAVVYSGVVEYVYPSKVQVIHDGYSQQQFQDDLAKENIVTIKEYPVISLVGRIAPWKGQDIFLNAAADVLKRFPKARFRIVGTPMFGEDDYEKSLKELVQKLGIGEQVEFLGFRDDIPVVLSETDIVVHASTLGEPFGQVVIEGMAAGKPVIATDGGALPEIVETGKTGMLVPMGDAPAMAEAIEYLLSNPYQAYVMGLAGQRRVQERFTIRHTVAKVEALYDLMLTPGAPPMAGDDHQGSPKRRHMTGPTDAVREPVEIV